MASWKMPELNGGIGCYVWNTGAYPIKGAETQDLEHCLISRLLEDLVLNLVLNGDVSAFGPKLTR